MSIHPPTSELCPDEEALIELAEGTIASSARGAVVAHLDECTDCLETVTSILRAGGNTRARPLEPGRRFADRYVIERFIGRGAMGHVYAARDDKLGRRVALKLLADSAELADDAARDRFLRESRVMARLEHPNIIAIFDADIWQGQPYVSMRLIVGETMATWAVDRDWREVVFAYRNVALGLKAAHEAGVVHRDIKPSNILVDGRGDSILTDFGLASLSRGATRHFGDDASDDAGSIDGGVDPRLTRPGAKIGTPAYMAPERRDGSAADVRTDLYEFTASVYESLYGKLLARPAVIPVHARAGRLPRWLRALLGRGLASDPRARFTSVDELLAAFDRPRRRRRLVVAGASGLAIALAAGWVGTTLPESAVDRWCDNNPARSWWQMHGQALVSGDERHADAQRRLSRYVNTWAAVHDDVCTAADQRSLGPTIVRGQVSCLDVGLARLTGLVERVPELQRSEVTLAIDELPDPSRCLDGAGAALANPLPDDPARAQKVAELRTEIHRVQGYATALTGPELPVIETMRPRVDAVGYAPLSAELMLLEAMATYQHDPARSQQLLLDTALAAERAGHDVLTAQALGQLVLVTAFLDQRDRAAEHARRLEAAVARLRGRFSDIEGVALRARASAALRADAPQQAVAFFERAIEAFGDDQARAGACRIGIADALEMQGRDADALSTREAGIRHQENGLGELHPLVISSKIRLASAYIRYGRHAEGRALVFALIEQARDAMGEQGQDWANLLSLRAALAGADGDHEAAVVDLRQSLAITQGRLGPSNLEVARVLDQLAAALARSGRLDEALSMGRRALAIEREVHRGKPAPSLGIRAINLSDLLVKAGEYEQAAEVAGEAIDVLLATVGRDTQATAVAYLRRGQARRLLEAIDDAAADVSTALEILGRVPGIQGPYAMAHYQMAVVRYEQGEREEALALANRAIVLLRDSDSAENSGRIAAIETFIRDNFEAPVTDERTD